MTNYDPATQQALIDIFRQSFAPIAQGNAGRVAIAQAQVQRQAELQSQLAAIDEQNRAAGVREQALESQRTAADTTRETALEKMRSDAAANLAGITQAEETKRQLATSAQMATQNLAAAKQTHDAAALAAARKTAADLGLADIDPSSPTYVNDVTSAAAHTVATHRTAATQLYKDRTALTQQISQLSDKMQVPPDQQLAIAKRALLATAADDPKLKAQYSKLNTLDDVMAAAPDPKSIQSQLDTQELLLQKRYAPQTSLLSRNLQGIDRQLQVLEAHGISPDYDKLNAVGGSDEDEAPAAPAAVSPMDISKLLPPGPGASAAPAAAPPGKSNALTIGTGVAATAALNPTVRSLLMGAASKLLGRGVAAGAGATGLLGAAAPAVGAALTGYGVGNAVNSATNNALPDSLAGLVDGGGLPASYAALTKLNAAIASTADPAVRGQLRALKYGTAPVTDDTINMVLNPQSNVLEPVGF